jgi:hypothetical protein
MEPYRYQELIFLVVPVMLGMEFFMTSRNEKRGKKEIPLGSYVLDFCGFIFTALVPSIFIFTIWAIETGAFPFRETTLARLDRYGVMFFFMGAWWQVYMIGALRARRLSNMHSDMYLWGPFLGLGIFISLLVLWVSPWNLKWISIGWFIFIAGILHILKANPGIKEKVLWFLAGITFFVENILFMWLEAII